MESDLSVFLTHLSRALVENPLHPRLVPLLMTGRPADYEARALSAGAVPTTLRCGSEAAPAGSCPMGLDALPKGLRSVRFSGADRAASVAISRPSHCRPSAPYQIREHIRRLFP